MIAKLHHAQITVPRDDVERARQFYCVVLGLQEIPKPASLAGRGGFWLALGDQEVHVSIEEGVDRTATKAHLAYYVTDLGVMSKRLVNAGIEIVASESIPGYARFEFRDPFGNRVEFITTVE